MQPYANHKVKSKVVSYAYSSDCFLVEFRDGSVREYTRDSAGSGVLRQLQTLADQGHGLGRFIAGQAARAHARTWHTSTGPSSARGAWGKVLNALRLNGSPL